MKNPIQRSTFYLQRSSGARAMLGFVPTLWWVSPASQQLLSFVARLSIARRRKRDLSWCGYKAEHSSGSWAPLEIKKVDRWIGFFTPDSLVTVLSAEAFKIGCFEAFLINWKFINHNISKKIKPSGAETKTTNRYFSKRKNPKWLKFDMGKSKVSQAWDDYGSLHRRKR